MITKSSQLEHGQMYLLCIHIEYVLVHDSIRWDLMRPQPISPTNWSCATCKGMSSRAEAARATLVDMIRVFHPEILPDHEPVYYDILKK